MCVCVWSWGEGCLCGWVAVFDGFYSQKQCGMVCNSYQVAEMIGRYRMSCAVIPRVCVCVRV